MIFFFKHKTAYEMRISDWSSDVCSSDLISNRGLYRMNAQEEQGITVKDRAREKLRRDLGGVIEQALSDPETVEIMLNADGKLWRERSEERRVGKECVRKCRSRW